MERPGELVQLHVVEIGDGSDFSKIDRQLPDGTLHPLDGLALNHQRFRIELFVTAFVFHVVKDRVLVGAADLRKARIPSVACTMVSSHERASSFRKDEKKRRARTVASCTTSSAAASLFVSQRA